MVSYIFLVLYIYCVRGDFIKAWLTWLDFCVILCFCWNPFFWLASFLACTSVAIHCIENEVDESERGFWVCVILLTTLGYQRFYISGVVLCFGAFVNKIYQVDLFSQSLPAFNDESWDAPLEDKVILWTAKFLIESTFPFVFVASCAGNATYFARLFSPDYLALVPDWNTIAPIILAPRL